MTALSSFRSRIRSRTTSGFHFRKLEIPHPGLAIIPGKIQAMQRHGSFNPSMVRAPGGTVAAQANCSITSPFWVRRPHPYRPDRCRGGSSGNRTGQGRVDRLDVRTWEAKGGFSSGGGEVRVEGLSNLVSDLIWGSSPIQGLSALVQGSSQLHFVCGIHDSSFRPMEAA